MRAQKKNTTRTAEDPRARLRVQALHLALTLLALVRERLGGRAVAARVRVVALLERARHGVARGARARAQRRVVRVLLVLLVEVLWVGTPPAAAVVGW